MKIQHLRNATALLTLGDHCLVLDPMLAKPGSFPGFKLFGGGRRANPLVALPPGAEDALEKATGVLVTHEHPDHLDVPAIRWIKERELPVWASSVDAPNLKRKGLQVRALPDPSFGMPVEVVPARHGRGILGWLMGPVAGFYLAHPDEPSVYVTGDTVWTEEVADALSRLRPEVVVAPAGAANFGIGSDILFSLDGLAELARRSPGEVVFNHLESVDHCPTTRAGLRQRLESEGLGARAQIPEDGEVMHFDRHAASPHASFDVIRATFPGGTITGVPKVRCMEIIDELEPVARGPYTGSIGYISFNGDMDMNIIIRTFLIKNKTAYVQAGAGIVADSDPEREYCETLKKAEALIKTLEVL